MDTDLICNQLSDSISRNGDVVRSLAIVSHKHIDGAKPRIRIHCLHQKWYARIETIDQRPVLGLILNKSQVESDHQVDEPIQYGPLFWFNDLAVHLIPSFSIEWADRSRYPPTGRNGGEIILLTYGDNSSRRIRSLRRCLKHPASRTHALLRHLDKDL